MSVNVWEFSEDGDKKVVKEMVMPFSGEDAVQEEWEAWKGPVREKKVSTEEAAVEHKQQSMSWR